MGVCRTIGPLVPGSTEYAFAVDRNDNLTMIIRESFRSSHRSFKLFKPAMANRLSLKAVNMGLSTVTTVSRLIIEPRCEKTGFCICDNKDADQLRGNPRS